MRRARSLKKQLRRRLCPDRREDAICRTTTVRPYPWVRRFLTIGRGWWSCCRFWELLSGCRTLSARTPSEICFRRSWIIPTGTWPGCTSCLWHRRPRSPASQGEAQIAFVYIWLSPRMINLIKDRINKALRRQPRMVNTDYICINNQAKLSSGISSSLKMPRSFGLGELCMRRAWSLTPDYF